MDSGMLSCPHCGSTDLKVKPVWKTWFFVACNGCKAGGPVRKTEEEAVEAWNTRHVETCTREAGFCSACGSFHVDGINYCPYCGRKVVQP